MQAVQGSLSYPLPTRYQSKINLLIPLILNYLNVEIIVQVKFSCSLCPIVSYAKLQIWVGGGGKLSMAVYHAPQPSGYQSKLFYLFYLFEIILM